VSLLNIISELKKACNHPFLFESAEDEYRGSEEDKSVIDRLILTSGKMVLLDKLLRRLRDTGHRVLVFSQVSRALTRGVGCRKTVIGSAVSRAVPCMLYLCKEADWVFSALCT
jgi:hypothetical protein